MSAADPTRLLVVADSDSYVKWGAATGHAAPQEWETRLVVARGDGEPTDRQVAEAVRGTRFAGRPVERVGATAIRRLLQDWEPDVVVASGRGWTVQALVSMLPRGRRRPVVVTGLAGISVPVLREGLYFRRDTDVFVVHSRRELREFQAAGAQAGVRAVFELGTLPFLLDARPGGADAARDRVVFAAQAVVPAQRDQRRRLVERLADAARARPDLRLVVKVRAQQGELQTHPELVPYDELLDELRAEGVDVPANLTLEGGAMSEHLTHAVGLVSVSSTAVLEALAHDVPALVLDDFGVGAEQINVVFEGSGLLGSTADLVAGDFRRPDPDWLDENYFHDPAQDTWLTRVERLLHERERGALTPLSPGSALDRARSLYYRHMSFAPDPRSPRDRVAASVLRVGLSVNRLRWRLRGR